MTTSADCQNTQSLLGRNATPLDVIDATQLTLPIAGTAQMLPVGVNHCPACQKHFSIRRAHDWVWSPPSPHRGGKKLQFCTDCDWWAGDADLLPLARGL